DSAAKSSKKPKRLGRGLSSLLNEPVAITPAEPAAPQSAQPVSAQRLTHAVPQSDEAAGVLRSLAVSTIVPNRHQPRQHFDEEALERLARSIASAGVMQPIVVRPLAPGHDAPHGAAWELIAGERRWRAAQRAGLSAIPAVVSDLTDREAAEW